MSLLLILGAGVQLPAKAEDLLAVSAKVVSGYSRAKLADGTFAPETYVFKEGGCLSARVADPTIDAVPFTEVSETIANALAGQNFIRSQDTHHAKLLIVLYWGTSRAPAELSGSATAGVLGDETSIADSAPEITQRGVVRFRGDEDQYAGQRRATHAANNLVNEEDAMMLGFPSASDPELRHYRYFVVLLAYDMETLRKKGKQRLLWQARFSMREQFHAFNRDLPRLAEAASPYFGQDSRGLQHQAVPEGQVKIGEVMSLGEVADPSLPAALSSDGRRVAYLTTQASGSVVEVVDFDQLSVVSIDAVPRTRGHLVKLAWERDGSLLATLDGVPMLTLDPRGKRGRPGTSVPAAAVLPSTPAAIRFAIESKLPDRKIGFLGQDLSGVRHLVSATNSAGETRYFVYDSANDLLFEVGRATNP